MADKKFKEQLIVIDCDEELKLKNEKSLLKRERVNKNKNPLFAAVNSIDLVDYDVTENNKTISSRDNMKFLKSVPKEEVQKEPEVESQEELSQEEIDNNQEIERPNQDSKRNSKRDSKRDQPMGKMQPSCQYPSRIEVHHYIHIIHEYPKDMKKPKNKNKKEGNQDCINTYEEHNSNGPKVVHKFHGCEQNILFPGIMNMGFPPQNEECYYENEECDQNEQEES